MLPFSVVDAEKLLLFAQAYRRDTNLPFSWCWLIFVKATECSLTETWLIFRSSNAPYVRVLGLKTFASVQNVAYTSFRWFGPMQSPPSTAFNNIWEYSKYSDLHFLLLKNFLCFRPPSCLRTRASSRWLVATPLVRRRRGWRRRPCWRHSEAVVRSWGTTWWWCQHPPCTWARLWSRRGLACCETLAPLSPPLKVKDMSI